MANQYGKTWWGKKWLDSLSSIDYSNRLPRGRSYANRGFVESISIEGNLITAVVAGSRPRPYKVEIGVPSFAGKSVKQFIQQLTSNPSLISSLLNGELDPALLEIAAQNEMQVFPTKWDDLNMYCSCPDWAVPCKHLAAVIYKTCNEIDNDPFLVFGVHGLNLMERLKQKGLQFQNERVPIPLLSALLEKPEKPGTFKEEDSYRKPDLSQLQDLTETIPSLLKEDPAFYITGSNFRSNYIKHIKSIVRKAKQLLNGRNNFEEIFDQNSCEQLIELSRKSKITFRYNNNAAFTSFVNGKKTALLPLMAQLRQIPANRTLNYQPSVAATHTLINYCFHLLAAGSVVPQIIQLKDKLYGIRWLPALVSKEVQKIHSEVLQILPPKLILNTLNKPIGKDHLISAVLSNIIFSLFDRYREYNLFEGIFFTQTLYAFNKVGEKAVPGGIAIWLQKLYLTQGRFKPALIVNEGKGGTFDLELHVKQKGKSGEKSIPIKDLFQYKKFEPIKYTVLQSITPLRTFIPKLSTYINTHGQRKITFSNREFSTFLFDMIPALRLLDVDILLPKSLQELLRPKVGLKVSAQPANRSFLNISEILQYERHVAVGDELLSKEEFQKLVKQSDQLIRYKSKYIYIDGVELENLYKKLVTEPKISKYELLRSALSEEYRGAQVHLDTEVKEMIAELTKVKSIQLPRGLKAKLRPYQKRGYSWMYRNAQIGFGSVLADDMGLGKTIQVITFLLRCKELGLQENKKALIVVPTGLLTNWEAEIEKFAPALKSFIYHGSQRELTHANDFDIILTSYGVLRSDATRLNKLKWHTLVIDEAQNIKNNTTKQSRAVKSIKADNFIALSGTPVENRLSELWSIMDFSNRGLLGTVKGFNKEFANPIEAHNDVHAARSLKKITSPFLMRRLKTDKDIIADLPEKIEMDAYAHLTNKQAALYEKTLQEAMRIIEQVDTTDKRQLFKRQGLILQMILALKQICNHPTQFLKNKVYDAGLSGKVSLLFELLENILDNNKKVLIFSQFKEMCMMLQQFISEKFDEQPLLYHGGNTIKQRKKMIESFQNNRADRIFILSIKAAGTGLNLTAANHVIHYDLWWNPAIEAQATDRAYRIGQKKDVMVHRFITKGTFEEKINEMIQRKKSLAELTVATGENWIGNLSNKELKEVFGKETES